MRVNKALIVLAILLVYIGLSFGTDQAFSAPSTPDIIEAGVDRLHVMSEVALAKPILAVIKSIDDYSLSSPDIRREYSSVKSIVALIFVNISFAFVAFMTLIFTGLRLGTSILACFLGGSSPPRRVLI